jgi:CHAT domain-containing protein
LLSGEKATKNAFVDDLPRSRYVHRATHGFFARAAASPVPLGARGIPFALLPAARFRMAGRLPELLTGLVFAGVDRPDRTSGDTVLTALEASDLDLRKVDLFTLSACNTGLVGAVGR